MRLKVSFKKFKKKKISSETLLSSKECEELIPHQCYRLSEVQRRSFPQGKGDRVRPHLSENK